MNTVFLEDESNNRYISIRKDWDWGISQKTIPVTELSKKGGKIEETFDWEKKKRRSSLAYWDKGREKKFFK